MTSFLCSVSKTFKVVMGYLPKSWFYDRSRAAFEQKPNHRHTVFEHTTRMLVTVSSMLVTVSSIQPVSLESSVLVTISNVHPMSCGELSRILLQHFGLGWYCCKLFLTASKLSWNHNGSLCILVASEVCRPLVPSGHIKFLYARLHCGTLNSISVYSGGHLWGNMAIIAGIP